MKKGFFGLVVAIALSVAASPAFAGLLQEQQRQQQIQATVQQQQVGIPALKLRALAWAHPECKGFWILGPEGFHRKCDGNLQILVNWDGTIWMGPQSPYIGKFQYLGEIEKF